MTYSTKILMCLCAALPVLADSVTVVVRCSDGKEVANLPIAVYDSTNRQVDGVSKTDVNGYFTIQNSETYSAPFDMFFTAYDSSTCGAYNVIQDTPDSGFVFLNYYPVNLPCSCSNYTVRSATCISR